MSTKRIGLPRRCGAFLRASASSVALAMGLSGAASAAILERISPPPGALYVDQVDYAVMSYSGTGDITAPVQVVDFGSGNSGCEAADFAGFSVGSIALIERGTCTFAVKATNAYNAGASAVLIFNNIPGLFFGTLGNTFELNIAVMGLTNTLGAELVNTTGLVMRVAVTEDDVNPAPEPATLALLGLGLAAVAATRRRRR